MFLAKDLWSTYHRKLYVKWGYATFDDYLNKEVGISKDYARRMRRIFSVFVLKCGVKPADLDEIGRSKAQILLPVVDKTNAHAWIAKAKVLPYGELQSKISAAKTSKGSTEPATTTDALITPGKEPVSLARDETPEKPATEFIPRTFRLPVESDTLLDEALGEAQRTTKSASPGFNLTCIAQHFLAQRLTEQGKKDGRLHWFMRQMERIYGGRLIHIKVDKGWDLLREVIENNPDAFSISAEEHLDERGHGSSERGSDNDNGGECDGEDESA